MGRSCESAPRPGTNLPKVCRKETHLGHPNRVIEKSAFLKLMCELRCIALSHKYFSLTEAPNSVKTDAENSSGTTAKLFQRARELEGREGASRVNSSNTEDPDANADGAPLVLKRIAAQRSAGPPPVTGTAHNQSYKASPSVKDGRDNTSAGESGVASSASYGKGSMQSASQWGSDGSARELDARHRQAKEAHNNMDEDTPVISASAFKGYTNRTEALPPGWELKIDQPTGRKFYVNHQLKAISWDRPRASNGRNGPTEGISRSFFFCPIHS